MRDDLEAFHPGILQSSRSCGKVVNQWGCALVGQLVESINLELHQTVLLTEINLEIGLICKDDVLRTSESRSFSVDPNLVHQPRGFHWRDAQALPVSRVLIILWNGLFNTKT